MLNNLKESASVSISDVAVSIYDFTKKLFYLFKWKVINNKSAPVIDILEVVMLSLCGMCFFLARSCVDCF